MPDNIEPNRPNIQDQFIPFAFLPGLTLKGRFIPSFAVLVWHRDCIFIANEILFDLWRQQTYYAVNQKAVREWLHRETERKFRGQGGKPKTALGVVSAYLKDVLGLPMQSLGVCRRSEHKSILGQHLRKGRLLALNTTI